MSTLPALIRNGNDDEAIAELERAISLRPNLAAAWLQLGELHVRRKETPAAIVAFKRLLARAGGPPRCGVSRPRAGALTPCLACGRGVGSGLRFSLLKARRQNELRPSPVARKKGPSPAAMTAALRRSAGRRL
jgi:hypothetical protein